MTTTEQATQAEHRAITWKAEGQMVRLYAALPCRPGTVVCIAEVSDIDVAGSNPAIRFLGHEGMTTLGQAEQVCGFVRRHLEAMQGMFAPAPHEGGQPC